MIELFLTKQNNAAECIGKILEQDIKIARFSYLKIDHKEGKPAELVLKMAMPYRQDIIGMDLSPYDYGYLMYQKSPKHNSQESSKKRLFFGKLRETITGLNDITFVFVSDIEPFENQWKILAQHIKKDYPPHEVWTQENPETILASSPYVLYWDRSTGKLGISHVQPGLIGEKQDASGPKTYRVISEYDPNYRHHRIQAPLTTVNVEMVARWDEIGLRYINIGQQIERQFPNHRIGTATPLSLERGWPKISRLSNRYFISKSSLTERETERYRIPVQNLGQDSQKTVIVECKFYDAQLEVGYIYKQPRQETLKYTLNLPAAHSESGRAESVFINVPRFTMDEFFPLFRYHNFYQNGDVVQQEGRVYQYCAEPKYYQENVFARDVKFSEHTDVWQELPEYSKRVLPVFSDTIFGLGEDSSSLKLDLGMEFVQYSLKCAKMKLLKDRSHIVELRGTLHDWHGITLNDTVEIDDPRDSQSGHLMKCKVTRYQLEYTNESMELAHINLEAAVEIERQSLAGGVLSENAIAEDRVAVDGVAFEWSKDLPPPCPIKNKPEDEFCHVVVLNKAKDQIQAIENQEKITQPWEKNVAIENKNTRILIKAKTKKEEADALKNSTRYLEHTISAVTVVDSKSWFPIQSEK
jgi:hypothetical protein